MTACGEHRHFRIFRNPATNPIAAIRSWLFTHRPAIAPDYAPPSEPPRVNYLRLAERTGPVRPPTRGVRLPPSLRQPNRPSPCHGNRLTGPVRPGALNLRLAISAVRLWMRTCGPFHATRPFRVGAGRRDGLARTHRAIPSHPCHDDDACAHACEPCHRYLRIPRLRRRPPRPAPVPLGLSGRNRTRLEGRIVPNLPAGSTRERWPRWIPLAIRASAFLTYEKCADCWRVPPWASSDASWCAASGS